MISLRSMMHLGNVMSLHPGAGYGMLMQKGRETMENSYKFFQNTACEYFPCHKVKNSEDFNCLFCYCPLYALGDKCGGNCTYTEAGIKDCTNCLIPHSPAGYDYINDHFRLIAELAKGNRNEV